MEQVEVDAMEGEPPGEDPHVAAPDEVVVVEAEERVGGGEELWVEHHLGGWVD